MAEIKLTNKDKGYIAELAEQFGQKHEADIARLYREQLRLLEEEGVLSDIAYNCIKSICRQRYRAPIMATKHYSKKIQLFTDLGNILCPDYMRELKLSTASVYLQKIQETELELALNDAKKFEARTSKKKIAMPRGMRPERSHWKTTEYKKGLVKYIMINTGIRLPIVMRKYEGIPAPFYESIAKNLGLL